MVSGIEGVKYMHQGNISLSIWSPLNDGLKLVYRGTQIPIPMCPFTDGVKLKCGGTCRTIPMLFVYCRRKCVEAHIGLSTWCPFIDSVKFLCQVTKRKLQAVTFLTYIGEVAGWNLDWHTSYPHCVFCQSTLPRWIQVATASFPVRLNPSFTINISFDTVLS